MKSPSETRSILWIVAAAVALVGVAVLASIALMTFAARTLDRLESVDEQELVERTIARDLQRMTRELTSATVWDDALEALSGPVDFTWSDINIGQYYSRYFDHDLTFVERNGQVIYASVAGVRADTVALSGLPKDARALVAKAAARAADIHARGGWGLADVSTASGLIKSGDEIYLVVVSDLIRENAGRGDPGPPTMVVSARRMGATYVRGLQDALGIPDLALTTHPGPDRVTVPLYDIDGQRIGAIAWPPRSPGTSLLRDASPWLMAAFIGMLACATVLFLRVGDALRRLQASQDALVAAKDEAEHANAVKSQFLTNMTHELRTPLNGVLGMGEVMLADDLLDRQRARLKVVTASANALLGLLNNILDMARLEGRSIQLRAEPFMISALLEGVVALFAGAATSKGVKLGLVVAPECHGIWIGDEVRLRQVLSNLVGNAVKFTAGGSVNVTARAAGSRVTFAVSDTGSGIAPSDQDKLFQPFTQVDGSLTRAHDGPGLGLAISQELVSLMGGSPIRVQSAVGAGSTFSFDVALERERRPRLRLVGQAGATP